MGRTLVVAATAFLLIQLVNAGTAEADCASPRVTVAPKTGAAVPSNPVVYVFVPTWSAPAKPPLKVTSGRMALAHTVTEVSRTKAFVSYRVAIKSKGASAIDVSYAGDKLGTYAIDAKWKAPASRQVKILGASYKKDEWSCSYTNAHLLNLSAAPAYKLEWAATEADFKSGKTKTIVFPHSSSDFWSSGSVSQKILPDGKVWLGHMSCFGSTAPDNLKLDKRFVRVVALHPDGVVPTYKKVTKKPAPAGRLKKTVPFICGNEVARRRRLAARRDRQAAGRQWPWMATLFTGFLGFFLARRRLRYASDSLRGKVGVLNDASIPQILFIVYTGCSVFLALRATELAASSLCSALGLAAVVGVAAFVAGAAFAVSRSRAR